MNINKMLLLASLATAVSAGAQVTLNDKNSQAVDLGYGVEINDFLTTAATTTIPGEELQQTSATNLADALYGRLPGLTALKKGGFTADEDKGASFNIRGYHTLNEKDILILVDGYERPIDRLPVHEVESVTVLKDAAAVALLGHEGVNGAILVTTKRGKVGETKVTVDYSHKFTFDPEFAEMVDGYGYATAYNRALQNDGLSAAYTNQELELFKNASDPFFYPNVNWQDKVFNNSASEDHAYITIEGGSDRVQYYTTIDYTDVRGLLKDANQAEYNAQLRQSKANVRANIDFKLTSSTDMSVGLYGIFQETKAPADVDADGAVAGIYGTPASAFPYQTSTGIWGGNEAFGDANVAAKVQSSGFMKSHQRQLWANGKLTQDFGQWIKGLSAFISAAYANSSVIHELKTKSHQYGYEYYTGAIGDKNNVAEAVFGDKGTNLEFSNWVNKQWWIANSAIGVNYKTSFQDNDNFAASLIYTNKGESHDGQHRTFYRQNIMGVFHYDYDSKYLADLVLAGTGSNRTYPSKWSFSPTLSLGWIYANNAESMLNYGKLRLSGGIQHTDYMPGGGLWLSVWNDSHGYFVNGTNYNESWGATLGSFPTVDFAQETSKSVNLGTDLRLFNALDVTADAFYQRRSHIMLSASHENSDVVGIQSSYSDVGEVESYGFELGLKYAKKINKDLYVNLGANLSWNRNNVVKYIGTPTYPNSDPVGHRVNEAWGLQSAGFFKNQADIDASPTQEYSSVTAGDIKYLDVTKDGVVNEFDVVALNGSVGLPELNYAFNLGFEYKGIGFNAWFQGTGNYMANLRDVTGVWNVMSGNKNLSVDYYNNCWDVLGDNALYPRLSSQANTNNEQNSDVWYKSVHFLKLRNCEVYYKLPATVLSKLGMTAAKVYVQGENLLSFDNVDAMDAEVLSTAYPTLKGVNVGLNLTF